MPLYRAIYIRMGKGDSLRNPPAAMIDTTDEVKFFAFVDRVTAQGYVPVQEYDDFRTMLGNMVKARELNTTGVFVRINRAGNKVVQRKAYDPATAANRPSGMGQKPMPKPTRDYQGSQMPATPWTPTHSAGTGSTVSTKRFPNLGGKTGAQSRGE